MKLLQGQIYPRLPNTSSGIKLLQGQLYGSVWAVSAKVFMLSLTAVVETTTRQSMAVGKKVVGQTEGAATVRKAVSLGFAVLAVICEGTGTIKKRIGKMFSAIAEGMVVKNAFYYSQIGTIYGGSVYGNMSYGAGTALRSTEGAVKKDVILAPITVVSEATTKLLKAISKKVIAPAEGTVKMIKAVSFQFLITCSIKAKVIKIWSIYLYAATIGLAVEGIKKCVILAPIIAVGMTVARFLPKAISKKVLAIGLSGVKIKKAISFSFSAVSETIAVIIKKILLDLFASCKGTTIIDKIFDVSHVVYEITFGPTTLGLNAKEKRARKLTLIFSKADNACIYLSYATTRSGNYTEEIMIGGTQAMSRAKITLPLAVSNPAGGYIYRVRVRGWGEVSIHEIAFAVSPRGAKSHAG
ncbi:MAG: hypothetical protein PHW65_06780 [Dehalococcoidales bacterium]|nr:hypothetical protein [Dehalococcoidales bacterium]